MTAQASAPFSRLSLLKHSVCNTVSVIAKDVEEGTSHSDSKLVGKAVAFMKNTELLDLSMDASKHPKLITSKYNP